VITTEPFTVRLRFNGDLNWFLKSSADGKEVQRQLKEPTSTKDVIESCGVPHPEVDRILLKDTPVDFSFVVRSSCQIEVYPIIFPNNSLPGKSLQRRQIDRFVADGHLGKLGRNLRLLGFDVVYNSRLDDPQLLQVMQGEQRALLTRDRRLLMHGIVEDGYCPRSSEPTEQTIEVVRRFCLTDHIKPFTRCLQCNAGLQQIDKAAVLNELEPLTRVYYDEFRRCTGCGKLFWRGSHFSKLQAFVDRFRQGFAESATA
jgi:uncharacterized protein with PIN domain